MSAVLNLDTIRIFIHILSVAVWVGGQIAMMAIMPILKEAGIEGLAAKVAQGFSNIAFPALAVAIFSGVWNILAIDMANATMVWNIVFGIKFLLVILSGFGAVKHKNATDPKQKGLYGAIGFGSAVIAMFLGYVI